MNELRGYEHTQYLREISASLSALSRAGDRFKMEDRSRSWRMPGTGASKLVNTALLIALCLLGVVLVSFLMYRKSLRRLVHARTQPCQLATSSSIQSKLEQLNRLPPARRLPGCHSTGDGTCHERSGTHIPAIAHSIGATQKAGARRGQASTRSVRRARRGSYALRGGSELG